MKYVYRLSHKRDFVDKVAVDVDAIFARYPSYIHLRDDFEILFADNSEKQLFQIKVGEFAKAAEPELGVDGEAYATDSSREIQITKRLPEPTAEFPDTREMFITPSVEQTRRETKMGRYNQHNQKLFKNKGLARLHTKNIEDLMKIHQEIVDGYAQLGLDAEEETGSFKT